jgi:NTP pyrophosphatase (non-canonical NTP hydrolase)
MKTILDLTEQIVKFRDERDWKQFHRPKDMALSLMLESAEVAELFQWRTDVEIEREIAAKREALGKELSDVLYWTLLLARDAGIDLTAAFESKMQENERKYPVDLAKGSNKKYTDLAGTSKA